MNRKIRTSACPHSHSSPPTEHGRRFGRHGMRWLTILPSVVACLLSGQRPAAALDGSWNVGGNSTWNTAGNWTNSQIADGTDFTAYFINNITADRTVTVDANRTIGNLIITDPTGSQNRTFTGGPLILSTTSLKPQIRVSGGATLTVFNLELTGNNGLRKEQANAIVLGVSNSWTGDTDINRGTLRAGHVNAIPSGPGRGNVNLQVVSGNPNLDLGSVSPIINGLNSTSSVALVNASGGAGTSILTVGAGDANGEYGGVIADGATRTVGLTKTGAGTQILTNINTYTGPTAVNGGVLKLNGDGSIASSSRISLSGGGTLDVTGITTLPFSIGASQTLGGGSSTGNIQGDTTLDANAPVALTYTKGTPSLNVSSGTLTLNGNNVTVDITGAAPLLDGSHKLISKSGSGSVVGTVGTLTITGLGIAGGGTPQLNIVGNELFLNITGGAPGVEWGSGDGTWADNVVGWNSGGTSVFTNGNVALLTDTFSTGNPTLTLNTTVLPQSVVVSSTNNYTVSGSGTIGGSASITKLGSGSLTLDVANTHTGGVAHYAGALNIKNASALGDVTGTFTVRGGTIDNTSGGALTLPNHPQSWGSTLNFIGSSDLNLGAGAVTMTTGCSFTVGGASKLTVGGDIAGAGFGFVKNGTGTLELNGNNTWTASSTLNLGEIVIGNDNALNGALGLSLVFPTDANSKTLTLNGHSTTIRSLIMGVIAGGTATVIRNNHASTPVTLTVSPNAAAQYAGTITDGGAAPLSLVKDGTQNWTFGGGGVGAATYSGDTIINQGTLTAGVNNLLPSGPGKGNLTVVSGATFDILDRSAMSLNGLSGAGTVDRSNPGGSTVSILTIGNADATSTFDGRIRTTHASAVMHVVKTGTGKLTLAGSNDYRGSTTNNSGILEIGAGGSAGSLTSTQIMNNAVLVFNRSGNLTYAGKIEGPGSVTNAGPGIVSLTGASTLTGPVTVTAGTLRINSPGSLPATTTVTVKSGATIGGTGTIGAPVTVEAGGFLAPGASVGTLTVNNTVSLSGTSVMEVSRDSGSAASDLLTGVTTLNYGGDLIVTNIGITSLRSGDSFNLFDAATINPGFANVNLPPLLPGLTWNNSLNADGTLNITGTVIPPQFTSKVVAGDTLTMSGSGGVAGGSYYVLTSPDVAAPIGSWTTVSTNVFDGSGNFSVQQTAILDQPQQFFMIAIP